MTYGYIYKTINLLNGKIYIGQRKNPFDSKYLGSGYLIRLAISKYGKENFKLQRIASAESKLELDALEVYYIKKYRIEGLSYNIANGGMGGRIYDIHPMQGRKHTEKSKRLMSESRSGKLNPNYGKDFSGINNPMFGRTHSLETRSKISNSNKGKGNPNLSEIRRGHNPWNKGKKGSQIAWNKGIPWSEEVKKRISIARKKAVSH